MSSGGVVFTTIQKFMPEGNGGKAPEFSKRRNTIVIADEAHRSQYDLIDGLARNRFVGEGSSRARAPPEG